MNRWSIIEWNNSPYLLLGFQVPKCLTCAPPKSKGAGLFFACGGLGEPELAGQNFAKEIPLFSVEAFDVDQNKWFQLRETHCPRFQPGAAIHYSRIYAIGGFDGSSYTNTTEYLDLTTGVWDLAAAIDIAKASVASCAWGKFIFAAGGRNRMTAFNTVERYDPLENEWTYFASLNKARSGAGMVQSNNTLYILGGHDGKETLATVERYCLALDQWKYTTPMTFRREKFGICTMGDFIFVLGGLIDGVGTDTCEYFNTKSHVWYGMGYMSSPRVSPGAFVVGKHVYAVGGTSGKKPLSTVERYDPVTKSWELVKSMDAARSGAAWVWGDVLLKNLLPAGEEVESVWEFPEHLRRGMAMFYEDDDDVESNISVDDDSSTSGTSST